MIRARVVVVVMLAITIFTATSSVLSGLYTAPASFSSSGDFVIMSEDAPTIFSSQVEVGLAAALMSVENVTGAWPEIIAFSTWNGVSFVLRGTDLEAFMPVLAESSPSTPELAEITIERTSAVVGARLLDRLDIEVPSVLPVTGSYSSRIEFVDVAGSFETGSYLDDELLVSLEVARHLTNTPEDMASVISVSTDDPEWLADVLSPEAARYALLNVHPLVTTIVVEEELTISMDIRNWGSERGDVTLSISEDGAPVDGYQVSVDAGSTVSVSRILSFSSTGLHSLDVSISGDFPVTATVNVSVVDPYLTLSSPSRVLLGETFPVVVRTYEGVPVEGAVVEFSVGDGSETVTTDEFGVVDITAESVGDCIIMAGSEGYTDASRTVKIIDLSSYPDEFLPVVRSFVLSSGSVTESEAVDATISVENMGAADGYFLLLVMLDSQTYTVLNISLGPAETKSSMTIIESLGVGTHTLQVGTFSHELVVEPWYADEPDLVQLVVRYGGSGVLSSSASVPIYQAAKISEGNVAVALVSIGAISALLATLAISAVFAKEVHESRGRLGILRTIGASKSQIRRMVLPQALGYGVIGAVAGVLAGLLVTIWLTRSGAFMVFGHQLSFEVDALLLLLVAVGAAVISVCSAFVSAEVAVRETPIASIRMLEPEPLPERSIEEMLGES
jgi:ABC-type lipoprotein release transport system permease subunit